MDSGLLFQEHCPPSKSEVYSFFQRKKMDILEADHFYQFYELKQWRGRNGNFLFNWKALAGKWIATAWRIFGDMT